MYKNLQCPSCSSVIAIIQDGKLIFSVMKAVSKVEINMDTLTTDAKCHTCHNWSSIDHNHKIELNYKRKSQDILFNTSQRK